MQKEKLRVLVAPMDWGLGHATRCIPLVNALQNLGIEVIIAAEGAQLSLLQKEFPHLNFIHLQGYRIHYTNSKRLLPIKIALQIPKILLTIKKERAWLKRMILKHSLHAVISDNRYGLRNKNVYSVFITHQLNIQTPHSALTKFVRSLNYKMIQRFNECWVPDFADPNFSLAGELSHPKKLPRIPLHYIGALSRFSFRKEKKQYDHTALISGPEPQRSLLEEKLRKHLPYLSGKKALILGKPSRYRDAENEPNMDVFNHATAAELQEIISSSENIICRSGYSTIMDLIALKKTALLIPTPGQTEQEYLAKYLTEKKWFTAVDQEELNAASFVKAEEDKNVLPEFPVTDLQQFVNDFLLRSNR